ncbi:MAG: ATP synthase F1 subunit epsilon [Bacilli bacterium]|nr:ATP synthase F1 subunit epsilon [Bacilli bacterium]
MKQLHLEILTLYGKYFAGDVDWIQIKSEDFLMQILPNHAPLVSSLVVSKMVIKNGMHEDLYAIGGGIVKVEKGVTTLLLNSIEGKHDIDINRANDAKDRAEKRLSNKDEYDEARAKSALERALNRISVYNS